MEYAILTLCALIGFIFGVIASRPEKVGYLRVDYSDPDGPYLFLELEEDGMQTIETSDYINLKVAIKDNSQK